MPSHFKHLQSIMKSEEIEENVNHVNRVGWKIWRND